MSEELTPEQEMLTEILVQSDAEELRAYDMQLPGQPLKWILHRSQMLEKQVATIPEYVQLMDGEEIVGFQRWGESLEIMDYGSTPDSGTVLVETRQRGE